MEIVGNMAGIAGDEGAAYDALRPTQFRIGPYVFDYAIARTAGAPDDRALVGLVTFRMPNGSLAGGAMRSLIESGAMMVSMVGAGGSLDPRSGVGSYQAFSRAAYGNATFEIPGEATFIPQLRSDFPIVQIGGNITVDSPLEESRRWLNDSMARGYSAVDVESAHILGALLGSGALGAGVRVTPGLFISDVVGGGEASLVEKISGDNAYANLRGFLEAFYSGVGIDGVFDADGKLKSFTPGTSTPNRDLIGVAESLPDLTRRKIMGVRLSTDDFQIVSPQKAKVAYPDFQSMKGHKHIAYVIPPQEEGDEAYRSFIGGSDPEKLFLVFPTNSPQWAVDLARGRGIETVIIVEPNDREYVRADYVISRDSGWGDYETVAAANSHAIAVFGDPSGYEYLLRRMDNERRRILVHERYQDAPAIAPTDEVEVFSSKDAAQRLNRALRLDKLENWVRSVRSDIAVIRLSDVRDYAEGRKIIGLSGSSKIAQFDPVTTEAVLRELLQNSNPDEVMFATGGTDYGVEKILHRLIREEFPRFRLIGFITNEGKGDDLGTPAVTIAGNDWFGKSVPFLNSIDFLITVAGGGVIGQELLMAHKAQIPIFPVAGSGMNTDKFLEEHGNVPRYYAGSDIAEAIAARVGQMNGGR